VFAPSWLYLEGVLRNQLFWGGKNSHQKVSQFYYSRDVVMCK